MPDTISYTDRAIHLTVRALCVVAGFYMAGHLAAWWLR